MAARTFTDSAGLTWDVFEVHRASKKPGAVSPGLENGWLAFASGEHKRRLSPFPETWEGMNDAELEALCESARIAPAPRYPLDRRLRPRIKRSTLDSELAKTTDSTDGRESTDTASASTEGSSTPAGGPGSVEHTVRSFAHEARARGLAAVAAMLELKTLLLQRHPEPDSQARDRQLVRRWFVEAYYFERDASAGREV
jgi:hypothetical protein